MKQGRGVGKSREVEKVKKKVRRGTGSKGEVQEGKGR